MSNKVPLRRGNIIFLNGVTSTGKTSITLSIQRIADAHYYNFSNDIFQDMAAGKYLNENYWKALDECIELMYHTAKLYSDLGKNVIIDGMLLELEFMHNLYGRLLDIMKDSPMTMVHVICPLDECRRRNIARGDRGENQSQFQHDHMTPNIRYDFEVDTLANSPDKCAEMILEFINLNSKIKGELKNEQV